MILRKIIAFFEKIHKEQHEFTFFTIVLTFGMLLIVNTIEIIEGKLFEIVRLFFDNAHSEIEQEVIET